MWLQKARASLWVSVWTTIPVTFGTLSTGFLWQQWMSSCLRLKNSCGCKERKAKTWSFLPTSCSTCWKLGMRWWGLSRQIVLPKQIITDYVMWTTTYSQSALSQFWRIEVQHRGASQPIWLLVRALFLLPDSHFPAVSSHDSKQQWAV